MKIKHDDKCSFCKTDNETILHMFTECPYARKFWKGSRFVYAPLYLSDTASLWKAILLNPKTLERRVRLDASCKNKENYLTLVGNVSGVYSQKMEKDTEMQNFPNRENTTEAIHSGPESVKQA